MKNIIKFPTNDALPTTSEEAIEQLTNIRSSYVDDCMPDILERLSSDLQMCGFNLTEKTEKEWFFFCESLQALLYKHSGVSHPFHKLIEDVIQAPKEASEEKPKPRKKTEKKNKQPKA